MAFWKKSDDPWDVDPARARKRRERAERDPIGNPLDTLRDWNEERKAKAAARQAELEAQPKEVCPWCGREMERGYMASGKGGLIWTPGWMTTRSALLAPSREARDRQLRVDNEGSLCAYKTVWYCGDCEKMVIDARGLQLANGPYSWPESSQPSGGDTAAENSGDSQGDGEEDPA